MVDKRNERGNFMLHDIKDMFSLEGKKALVVGGAGGLGIPICLALMHSGADIAVADQSS